MRFVPILLLALALAGCSDTTANPAAAEPKPEPMAEQKVPAPTLQASYEKAKGAFEGEKSEANEKAYVEATVSYATAVMAGDGKPREKYPEALRLYDEALALDPENDEAKTNKQLILDIYRSMGKEPPK
jgi:tetratricopeptide (TPR) repeat protein